MRRWWPLVAVCLGSFLFLLDTTVVTVALPAIGRDLHAPPATAPWVLNVYTLVLAVLMLGAGAVADRLGHRAVYVAGLALFAAASAGCALAPGIGALVAARGVQGVAGATLAVTTFALAGQVYGDADRATAFGVFFAVNGAGGALGPLAGGFLVQHLGWRAIFVLNVPVAVLAIVLTLLVVPAAGMRRKARLDLPGLAAFAVAAAALTWALTGSGGPGRPGWATPAAVVVAVAGTVAFVAVERRRASRDREAALDLALFRRPPFAVAIVATAVLSAPFGSLVFTSYRLQAGLGRGPLATGLAVAPLAVALFVTSTVSGRVARGVAPSRLAGAGLLLAGAGCVLQVAGVASGALASLPGLAVTGAGLGLALPVLGRVVVGAVPPERAGMVVGATTTFRQLGQTLAVACFGALAGTAGGGAASAAGLSRVLVVAAVVTAATGVATLAVRSRTPVATGA